MVGILISDAADSVEAAQLIRELTWAPLSAVYSGPLDRAVATAHSLADDHGLHMHVRPVLTDSGAGEALADVQRRIVDELMTLANMHPSETIAIVTPAESIRCTLAAFTGATLDDVLGVEISPARVSAIGITSGVRRVLDINVPAHEMAV